MDATTGAVAIRSHELLLYFTLLELAVIVLAGRLGGWAATRLRQTATVEILIGIVLGPSVLGWLTPGAFHYVFRSAPSEPLQILSSLGCC